MVRRPRPAATISCSLNSRCRGSATVARLQNAERRLKFRKIPTNRQRTPAARRVTFLSGPGALKQASNCLTIDRWYSPLKPIERGKPVVVAGGGIGAVIEKNLDGLHEACFGGIVQRGGPSAVGHLDSLASVVYARAVPQKRRDVLGI